jgi:decaprenylphospho-beta-D-erythro-pentofuranosid-2-ulose 2-reductase
MPSILILGAGSDMAQAVAIWYAKKGFDILLAARNLSMLQELQQDLSIRYQVNCTGIAFDAKAFSTHADWVNQLPVIPDITVLAFGVMHEESDAWEQEALALDMIDTNFSGAVSILQALSKKYMERGSGSLVGISSVAGDRGRASKLVYGASKSGLSAYLSGLRNKLQKNGIHVMTVKPGFVYTKMTENLSLPPLLTADVDKVAEKIGKGVAKKKNTIYIKGIWRLIMLIIQHIPEFMFKKMSI